MTSQVSLRLPDVLLRRLDEEAARSGKPRSQVIRELLGAALSALQDDAAASSWDRVSDLVGRYRLGDDDLASRQRERLAERIRDRRES